MPTSRSYQDACGIARALDVVGERWALLVVRELLLGPQRFSDLRRALAGASSNLVADRLGQFLVRAGKIDEETLKQAAEQAVTTRQRTGDVLISMGLLTEQDRLYYVGQQIKSILYSVFAWEEGIFTLSFQARARKEAIKLDIHPANLIMRGVKKLYKPERLRRLMPHRARPTPSQDPSFNLSDVELQAWEAHLLPRCDGTRTVAELVKLSGKPENEAWATLVALRALRVLDVRSR